MKESSCRGLEELFSGDEADPGHTRGVIEESSQDVFERAVDFPIVRGEAEVSAGAARALESLHQMLEGRTGDEAVTAELRMPAIPQHMRVDEAIRSGQAERRAILTHAPPVGGRVGIPHAL